jgi:hypothetical protein
MNKTLMVLGAVLTIVLLIAAACSASPGTAASTTTATGPIVTHATVPSTTTTVQVASSVAARPTTTKAPTTTTTAPSGYEWTYGEAVTFDGMVVQVEAPVEDPEAPYVDEGNTVWVFLVTITNNRTGPFEYWPMDYSLVDAEGFVYDCGGTATTNDEQLLSNASLAPGQTVKGYVAGEIPDSAVPVQVKYEPYISMEDWLALWSE